jgi:hypothetical protein
LVGVLAEFLDVYGSDRDRESAGSLDPAAFAGRQPLPEPGLARLRLIFPDRRARHAQPGDRAFQRISGDARPAEIGLRRFFSIVAIAISVSLLAGLASVLLIVPGVMLYMMWFVATSVCVVEQLGPFRSMGRSRELTRGHRWKIFGLILLTVIPAGIVGLIVGAVAVAALGTGAILGLSPALITPAAQFVGLLWSAIWKAFYAILAVVIYHDLRVAKEGVDTEQIAAVFE